MSQQVFPDNLLSLAPRFIKGLTHFDEILQEADGIILSRGNLGIDLPPEKVSIQLSTLTAFCGTG